jgi:hypothetical protein
LYSTTQLPCPQTKLLLPALFLPRKASITSP